MLKTQIRDQVSKKVAEEKENQRAGERGELIILFCPKPLNMFLFSSVIGFQS